MKKKEAFTLLEVVFAIAILAIAILPIMSMYPNALKISMKANNAEELSRTSITILDFIKSRGYTDISNKLTTTSTIVYNYGDTSTSAFIKLSDNSYTNYGFEQNFLGGNGTSSNLFFINTKGVNLTNKKFMVNIQKISPMDGTGNLIYGKYDLENFRLTTTSTTSTNQIIYGIIKMRDLNEDYTSKEGNRDMKFLITPMEEWGD